MKLEPNHDVHNPEFKLNGYERSAESESQTWNSPGSASGMPELLYGSPPTIHYSTCTVELCTIHITAVSKSELRVLHPRLRDPF